MIAIYHSSQTVTLYPAGTKLGSQSVFVDFIKSGIFWRVSGCGVTLTAHDVGWDP